MTNTKKQHNADSAGVSALAISAYPSSTQPETGSFIMTAEEWLSSDFTEDEANFILGTPTNALVRPCTKNFVEAPEKSFKTTFLLRLSLGLSSGESVFPSLPVNGCRSVLYLHGELSREEMKERLQQASVYLPRPLDNFLQGRNLRASLVTEDGRAAIRELVDHYRPSVLVFDPWQSFIAGAEENNFKEMSAATRFMDCLIAEYKVTIFIAIHQGKDHTRGARGHSVLAGWRDTRFLLKRDGATSLTVNVEPRWATPPKPLKLTFNSHTVWEGEAPKWTDGDQELIDVLTDCGGQASRKELGLRLGLKESTLRMRLKRARDRQVIDYDNETVWLLAQPAHALAPTHPI